MVTAIKQLVKVGAGGRVAVQSSELHEGESVEVIVMVERADSAGAGPRLEALRRLRQSLALSSSRATQWEAAVRAERAAWREADAST